MHQLKYVERLMIGAIIDELFEFVAEVLKFNARKKWLLCVNSRELTSFEWPMRSLCLSVPREFGIILCSLPYLESLKILTRRLRPPIIAA